MWVAASSATDPTSQLVDVGITGVILAALGPFLYLVYRQAANRAEEAYKREAARADRLEEQLNELHRTNVEKIIPALLTAAEVIRDSERLVRDMVRGQQ